MKGLSFLVAAIRFERKRKQNTAKSLFKLISKLTAGVDAFSMRRNSQAFVLV